VRPPALFHYASARLLPLPSPRPKPQVNITSIFGELELVKA
jgi:hypothetical protein